ncbi:glycosyltransferase [Hylemonella gracilis]|uniref:glycosyltransferase n=1 Tax=Hylemonella gracilis TaxID=80880 RepID=UPI0009DEF253|nr:glycosyltransferase [Hylemonella gracilis]
MRRVIVLLATHNGFAWLPEQTKSILGQQDVEVRLVISDDASSDGTAVWIQTLAAVESRVVLLPSAGPFGSAAKNFYRLLLDADFGDVDYVAFSDQDDIWFPDKLTRSVNFLLRHAATAVSSNVTAFWPDGRRRLVNKAQPQQGFDYLFEAAGPGCTYLMTVAFAREMRSQLIQLIKMGGALPAHHDWFCYAFCRMRGGRWLIDTKPSMDYRQHGRNEVGVNSGLKAAAGRHRKIASGWYRREVQGMASLARVQRPDDTSLASATLRLGRGSLVDRVVLALQVRRFRRRWRDRLILAAYFLTGLFWCDSKR